MKKGKLYTVTPWNKQALVKAEPLPAKNLFDGVNMPTQQMNNRRFGIGNYGGQQITFGTSNYGAAGNPFTPGTTAFNRYNIQSVENSISNGSYFNRYKDNFTYKPQNYVKGIDFTTDYNDTSQRWNAIMNSAKNGLGDWKNTGTNNNGESGGSGSKGKSKGMSAGAQQAIALGASALGSIDTGEKRGMWDTLDPVHHLAGGRETGFGNAMEDAGVALTQAGLSSGNYYLAIAGAAAKVVGGLSNAAFGYKIENEKAVNDNINRLANTNYNADDYDTLLSQDAAMGGRNRVDLGEVKNGWTNNKGTEKAKKLNATQDWALAFGDNSFENAEKNIQHRQLENALRWYGTTDFNRNQSAYGGPLDMKDNNIFDMGGGFNDDMPITNFGFVSDYLTTKRKQAEQKNVLGNMFAGAPNSMFAIGGDLQTNGSDWSTGLTHVDAGQSHEMNPYDGVQMGIDSQGVPNLVEEGEVIFNDYVYSQRITLDKDAKEKLHFPKKQDITYADAAKKLEREIKERPNDPISQAGFEAQMGDLAEEQERQKAEMEAAKAQEAFDSLSDEEKVAVMQQAAQQEQAMQEQAMAEQAAAQQQPTPEEMAMMEQQAAQEQMMAQQAAPQGIPEEAMMGAYGGLINRFDLGGLAWIKKNHPEVKNPQAVAKALEKMMQENKSNYYRPDSTSMFGNNDNKKYSWDFKSAWNEMSPSVKSLSAYERSLNKWVKYGLSREDAFRVSHPDSYYKGYRGDLGTERKRDFDAAYKRLVKDYNQPAAAPKPQPVKQGNRTVYKTSTGKVFPTNKQAAEYEKAYWRTINSERARQDAVQRAAQQQAPVEETTTRSAYRPPVAEAAANAEPTVTQAVAQNTERQAAPAQRAERKATDGINVGTYRQEGNQWNTYGLPGLQHYLNNAIVDYQNIDNPEEQRKKLQEIADTLNGVQESYYNNVAPTLGQSVQQRNKGVGEHQALYQSITNNAGFRGIDPTTGNVIDLTDQAIVMPEGHNTPDNLANGWVDEYSGPKTWLRYLGASGDDLSNEVARLREIGIDFSPYQDWTIGSGDNARQLYRASLLDAADNGAASNTPVQNNDGVVPVREEDYTLTEDELEAAGKKLDAQAKSGQGYVAAPDNDDWDLKPIHKQDWMRYAGIFGPAVGLGMQALGIGKPDASGIMAAANAASGPAHLATPHVIGDYMRYKPIDRLFEGNRILASSRATDRNLMNTSGGNRGTAMAGLLANGYNTQIALGNADMQAENVNWGRYGQTKDFNRGTNQFNAQALNQNSQFNADALNRQRQYAAQMQMQAAAQKADMDAAWYNGIYGNVAGLFKGIGDVGRENAQHNTVADMIASGIFGTMKNQPIANGFVEVVPKRSSAAKGGKIKRKKNKRGLTF